MGYEAYWLAEEACARMAGEVAALLRKVYFGMPSCGLRMGRIAVIM